MNNNTKLGNGDNGTVLMAEEAILDGVASDRPQDICTKYPEKCTDLQVAADDCSSKCCLTVVPKADGCSEPKEEVKHLWKVVNYTENEYYRVIHKVDMTNLSDQPITNIVFDIYGTAAYHYVPTVTKGVIEKRGRRQWYYTLDVLEPGETVTINIKTRYSRYALSTHPTADAPAELTEDSVLHFKHNS